MAADQTLVQGAGLVAQSEGVGKLAASQAGTAVSKHLSDGLSTVFNKRNKEFNAIMEAELNRDPGLSNKEYDQLYKKLSEKRLAYVYLNKKERRLAERDLLEEGQNWGQNEDFKKKISDDLTNKDLINDPVVKLGPNAKDITNIITGNKNLITKDGKPGYNMTNPDSNKYDGMTFSEAFRKNRDEQMALHGMDYSKWSNFMWAGKKTGGKLSEFHPYRTSDLEKGAKKDGSVKFEKEIFKSLPEIEGMIDEKKIDASSKDGVNAIIQTIGENASNIKPGESTEFNFQKEFNNIKTKIIEKGNLNSLVNDEIFGGRTFAKDLEEAIEYSDYTRMGFSEEDIKELDPTPNSRINRKDAKKIWETIMNDEEILKDYLAEYYTKFAEQNHYSNLNQNTKEQNQNQNQNQNQTQNNQSKNNQSKNNKSKNQKKHKNTNPQKPNNDANFDDAEKVDDPNAFDPNTMKPESPEQWLQMPMFQAYLDGKAEPPEVDKNLVSKNAKNFKSDFNEQYNKWGFRTHQVAQTGNMDTRVKIIDIKTGQSKDFHINTWMSDQEQTDKIKAWMDEQMLLFNQKYNK